MVVVVVTSLLRTRLGHRAWRAVHLCSWLAWGAAVAHSVGIGTDLESPTGMAVLPVSGCVVAVLVALAVRLSRAVRAAPALVPTGASRRAA
jgi:hypothetical protein